VRNRIAGLTIAVALVLIVVGPLVTPPPHEVRTPGAVALNTEMVLSDPAAHLSQPVEASQSLNDVRCAIWRLQHAGSCPDASTMAGLYFPQLTQSTKTLYIPWLSCRYTSFGANGFNLEYEPTRRAVVIHCYLATPLVWRRPLTSFASPQIELSLLLVRTSSLPAGPVTVIEDDRIEHLIGDQSTEHPMGTATIY
jgi:hypothetical protein